MTAISELPVPGDIDADYSPQYVKLARILRAEIESGVYKNGDRVSASGLMIEHQVSKLVAWAALRMLAANGYVVCRACFESYRVTWVASRGRAGEEHR